MINVKKFISENAETKYADFCRKFITTRYPIFGVRIPKLKKFAKQVEPEYIELDNRISHEEILLYIYSASQIKNETEQLEYLQNILPYIDNWCSCDFPLASLKSCKSQKSLTFFLKLLSSEKEFEIRVGIVGLMYNFLKSDFLNIVLANIKTIQSNAYYVQMALAWFYAELCSFDFETGYNEISQIQNLTIRNKAISKARESLKISQENKDILLKLRAKIIKT